MIALDNVSKGYPTRTGRHEVLVGLNAVFPDRVSFGVLGLNGAGKSTLLRLLGGVEQPDRGAVRRTGRISWPIGFSGAFNGSLSGEENCRFAARIYDAPTDRVVAYARSFAELGSYFRMPVRTYSSGMRARLAFGLSMALDFDTYLVDEVTAVGDVRFRRRCEEAFTAARERSAVIVVSHQLKTLQTYADRYALLEGGRLHFFDDFDEVARRYTSAA